MKHSTGVALQQMTSTFSINIHQSRCGDVTKHSEELKAAYWSQTHLSHHTQHSLLGQRTIPAARTVGLRTLYTHVSLDVSRENSNQL